MPVAGSGCRFGALIEAGKFPARAAPSDQESKDRQSGLSRSPDVCPTGELGFGCFTAQVT